ARKTGWSAAASLGNLAGRLMAQIIIARQLGPEGTGRIAYLVWLIEIANLLVCFGLPSSFTRFVAELHGRGEHDTAAGFARWVFVRYLALMSLGSLIVGTLVMLSPQSGDFESLLPLLMILFVARGLETINAADLAGKQQFDRLAQVNVVTAAALVLGVAAGALWFGLAGVLYGYIGSALIPAAYSFTILRGSGPRQPLAGELRRRVWSFSFHIWLAMVAATFVWSRMEIYFLERYWDVREVAMFAVGLTFTVMIHQIAMMFSGAFMAHFSNMAGSEGHDVIRRQYQTATRLISLVILPIAFGGAGIMPALLPLLFGADFAPAVPVAMVLTATSAFAFALVGTNLIYARECSRFIAASSILGVILSVTAGFWVVGSFGAWGAAWSRVFVQGSAVALSLWYIACRLDCRCPVGTLMRTAASAAACGFVAWGIVRLAFPPMVSVCLAVVLGVAVYAAGVKLLRVLGPEEIRQLRRVVNRLPVAMRGPIAVAVDAMGSSSWETSSSAMGIRDYIHTRVK
ncbi:MAG: oligosaccharide flippase family protein, partial [Patescibacteria group bacterium]|nr:oligosaccharide flippase family protein [Patescibacteria group bacterium]